MADKPVTISTDVSLTKSPEINLSLVETKDQKIGKSIAASLIKDLKTEISVDTNKIAVQKHYDASIEELEFPKGTIKAGISILATTDPKTFSKQ